MVFSSLTFLFLFLPLSLLAHYVSNNNFFRNLSLTIFSLIFYAWGEPMWIFLLLFTSMFDYAAGLLIEYFRGKNASGFFMWLGVLVNLSLLGIFKYGGFIWDNLNFLVELPFARPLNTLPIGISFYSFQTISYLVDVYRGEVKAQKNPLYFLLFVSLFHQLVAGPIVRYKTIAEEIEGRKINWEMISSGINRFCLGLFKKVIIANTAYELVHKYLEAGFSDLSCPEAWFGISMFSVQIYFDFSGYSDMAIGLGRLFGFHYEENFRHPYAAKSVGDFYRRWHISLGKFFRDYVYIPLGGNRKHQLRNILIVWLLTGAWHGASWNFVLWGAYFGCFMVLEKLLENVLPQIPVLIRHAYTLFLIVFSRAIFYFVDFNRLGIFVRKLFTGSPEIGPGFVSDLYEYAFWMVLVVLMCIPWDEIFTQDSAFASRIKPVYRFSAPWINMLFLLSATIMLVDSTYNPFIYFRF
jgi:alginate O-acetyltransferase complex protein AlgI